MSNAWRSERNFILSVYRHWFQRWWVSETAAPVAWLMDIRQELRYHTHGLGPEGPKGEIIIRDDKREEKRGNPPQKNPKIVSRRVVRQFYSS